MSDFNVLFFDGKTSSGKQGILKPEAGYLLIDYWKDAEQYTEEWDLSKIHPIEISGDLHILQYGDHPLQQIECRSKDFYKVLKQEYPNARFLKRDWTSTLQAGPVIAFALSLVTIIVGIYFWVLPPLAEAVAGTVPLSLEVEFGESLYKGFLSDSETNPKLTKLVNEFAAEVDFDSPYKLDITVVKSKQVNAFALPGGKIVVYDGIIRKLNTSEELAALLSHEAAHIQYKHSLKAISRNLSGYIFISLILNDLNGLTTVLLDNANTLNNLSYSRKLEADADDQALETLKKNSLSQKGLVGLFKILGEETGAGEKYVSFLSTHPLTQERLKHAESIAQKQTKTSKNPELDEIFLEIKKLSK